MIVGRTQNETARSICEYAIGKREIERHTVSTSQQVGTGGRAAVNRTNAMSVQVVDVVLPSQLLSDLGPDKKAGGVRILWLTGRYALRLLIPFTSPQPLRPACQLAAWTSHGARRPEQPALAATPEPLAEPQKTKPAGAAGETNVPIAAAVAAATASAAASEPAPAGSEQPITPEQPVTPPPVAAPEKASAVREAIEAADAAEDVQDLVDLAQHLVAADDPTDLADELLDALTSQGDQ